MSSIEKITVHGTTYEVGGSKATDIYPVGSIYMSVIEVDPSQLFGGTWTRIQDTFLLAAGSTYSAGSTGGAATVTLTTSQIPSHTHSLPYHTHSLPYHTHSLPSHTHSFSATTTSNGSHVHELHYDSYAVEKGENYRRYYSNGSDSGSGMMSSAGAHTHTISGTTGSTSGTSGSTSGTSGSTSGTSGAEGGGSSHNNMPPYLAVYMWQRVA